MNRPALVASARDTIARGSLSFSLASRLFDRPTRERAWLLYAWCRQCDDVMDGQAGGTVSLIEPRYATDFPRSLTAHDIGLRDLVESAALLGPLPKVYLVTVSIEQVQPMRVSLSPALEAAVPRVIARVADLVAAVLARDAAQIT